MATVELKHVEKIYEGGVKAVDDFKAYLRDLVARRQREGALDPAEILSTLIGATDLGGTADGGDRLSELELLHNCIFLLNAGHETTTNLIGNSVDLLIRHPNAMAELAAHPELIETAVEEFLRMESSNQLGNRRAAAETMIGDVAVPVGSYVHLCIGAANRDPAQFSDPDRLDLARAPNRHVAFGFGIHTCAGNSLARMEAQVAIGKLVARFGTIERAGEFRRGGRARFRGFLRYPVAVRGDRH
jgi:cytochrome P450